MMKKIMVFIFVVSLVVQSSVFCVLANTPDLIEFDTFVASLSESLDQEGLDELDEETVDFDEFQIVSGLAKNTYSTFDKTREIYGESLKGTLVVFDVYSYDLEWETFVLDRTYELEVGASGIFSKMIPLHLDKNYLLITASYDDRIVQQTAVIKRVDSEIKYELERGIVFPGQNFFVR